MAAPRTKPPLMLTPDDRAWLESLRRSRTAPLRQVERADILIRYAEGQSTWAIQRQTGFSSRKVHRCLDKALAAGPAAALEDLPRPGRPRQLTDADRAWIIGLACQKPRAFGYAEELWTHRLLAAHIRATAVASGHPAAAHVVASTVVKLLQAQDLHPHRVQYYLERRDPDFDQKMVRVLHVYEQVELAFDPADQRPTVRLSYDEKPGMQALGRTAPDRPPQPGVPGAHTWQRDYEYVRHGTRSLLAGLDLATGEVLGLVRARHRSAEFIEFLQLLDAHYAPDVKIQIVLDNHSAHTSRETQAYLATRPNRFEFVFTPKHGSWLNVVEMFFAKLTRQCLRHLRVDSLEEFDARLLQYLDQLNRDPVPFRWRATAEDLELRDRCVI